MPSMLGLTTDKSPHAMGNNNNNQMSRYEGQSQSQGQMTYQGQHQQPNGGSRPESSASNKKPKPKKDTIFGRNHAAALESETLVWRALCDDPSSAMEYIAKDAIMVNPFLFGDSEPRGPETEQTLEESLEDAQPWLSYKMHDPMVVEIDLMAVALVYKLTLFRQGHGNQLETVEASGGSSYRQTAGGDWRLTSMHIAKG
jgi:hypothetical protein